MPVLDRKWWTLIAVCTAIFMLLLDITVVNVALPDIQRSLHSTLQRPAVGGRRLRPDPGRLPAHRRRRRRHVRPARGVRRRPGRLLRLLARLRALHHLAHAEPLAGAPRASAGRSCSPPRWPSSPQAFQGRERGHRLRHLRGGGRRGGGGRPAGRRRHHQRDRLAVDLLRQRAHRRSWPSSSPWPRSGSPGTRTPARIDWIGFVTFSASLFLLVFALVRGNDAGWGSAEIVGLLVGVGRARWPSSWSPSGARRTRCSTSASSAVRR